MDDFLAQAGQQPADILHYLAVLLRGRELSLAEAERVLDGRRQH